MGAGWNERCSKSTCFPISCMCFQKNVDWLYLYWPTFPGTHMHVSYHDGVARQYTSTCTPHANTPCCTMRGGQLCALNHR